MSPRGVAAGRAGACAVLRYCDVRHALEHPAPFSPDHDGDPHGPAGSPVFLGPNARHGFERMPIRWIE